MIRSNPIWPAFLVLILSTACGASSPAANEVALDGETLEAAGLSFQLPGGWTAETPSSPMRAAQAQIPGSGGPGQLTVFFFGPGGGGGVDANLERWKGQIVPAAGTTALREMFNAGAGYTVTWIDSEGTLKASQIGSFPPNDMPNYRLFGGVVEGDGGPWFFRAIGPKATMAEQRDAFLAMLRAIGK